MLKRYTYMVLFFFSLSSCAQNKVTLYSKAYKIAPKINITLSADEFVVRASEEFNNNFTIVTGEILKIERSNSLNNNYSYIILRINPTQKDNYCFYKKGKDITIQGTTAENLIFGINAFFKEFTPLTYGEKSKTEKPTFFTNEINVPEEFSICSSPDFEYREPYFSPNFETNFRNWNQTNYLELNWGIWGHNLPKILKKHNLPETVYAQVGNKRIEDQYCFTSDTLYKYVNENVKRIYDSDHSLNKYMILPNDNELVCNCNTCKSVGNTSKDAAPAVFSFLNKLAKDYPNLSFFTTAYISVKDTPSFKAEDNVGIFYSTIDIQKGIPLEDSKYFDKFETTIKKWKNYLDNVYIWDYAVNFDNYFDIYPSLKVSQSNLKLYKKLGVKGVFMHGSEYDYSTFEELKATLFAKLLWNTDINLDEEIADYFKAKYPNKLSNSLTNYYTFIEDTFYSNKKELDIYSGINKTVKKYLDPKVFFSFYDEFDTNTQKNKFDKEYLKLATALTFLKLEIMRDYGLGEYGFGYLNKNQEIIINNEVGPLLDKLTTYGKSSKLTTYNEAQYKLDDYLKSWRRTIYTYHKRKHYFFKKPFEVLSKLDEDYTDITILNNGTFGLKDYNSNWHISSIDDLVLKIDEKEIKGSDKITFSFLQDTKHNIYYPGSIEIVNSQNKIVRKIELSPETQKLTTKEVTIKLPTEFDDNQLSQEFIVRIKKQSIAGKNAIACDEIIFN
ncbi:MAG: DUF4838 domain-containing protein [Polaribacter sp.]|uniref:DUF4838 domain-containing protein n=1 Tax=Polaribacter sp. TaxID=1920175 RepID=UPI003BAF03A7